MPYLDGVGSGGPATNITQSVVLKWDAPNCRPCEKSGGRCGFKGAAGSDVGWFGKHGLSMRAELVSLLGVVLLLLLLLVQTRVPPKLTHSSAMMAKATPQISHLLHTP